MGAAGCGDPIHPVYAATARPAGEVAPLVELRVCRGLTLLV